MQGSKKPDYEALMLKALGKRKLAKIKVKYECPKPKKYELPVARYAEAKVHNFVSSAVKVNVWQGEAIGRKDVNVRIECDEFDVISERESEAININKVVNKKMSKPYKAGYYRPQAQEFIPRKVGC